MTTYLEATIARLSKLRTRSLRAAHCSPLPLHSQAQAAIAVATAIRSYGRTAGLAYCQRQGLVAPAGLVRLARQLEACRRHGLG